MSTTEGAGVPVEEVTAKDFIMVRAALVRRLGGANEALVWSRIEYRASSAKHAHHVGENLWWAASRQTIAEEIGLTPEQVRRAIEKLVEDGFLLAERHHGSDRTMSYSPVILHEAISPDGDSHEAHTPDASGEIAASIGRNGLMHEAHTPDVPSIETFKKKRDELTAPDRFDAFWAVYPRKTNKAAAVKAWPKAVTKVGADALVQMATDYANSPARPEVKFVPHASTWLNGERWMDELPAAASGQAPKLSAFERNVAEMRRRQQEGGPRELG